MPQTHQSSFLIILILLFLLPLFFVPGGALNLGMAKSAFLVVGVIAATLFFCIEVWRKETVRMPWHLLVPAVILLTALYALSAFLTTPSSLSLLGYNFEVGTFGYMLLSALLLLLGAIIFSGPSRALQALAAFFLSISILAVFMAVKILVGWEILVWGNFFGNMGNPLGSWTDLAVAFGLLAVFASLAAGMISMKASLKFLVYGVFVLAAGLLVVINFFTAFILTLAASVFLLLYFLKLEKPFSENIYAAFLPLMLCIVSIIFLINPVISETKGTIGEVISRTFQVENIEVRPSFSATLGISKAVLSEGGFLGSGPNTFSRDWLIYKPVEINTTPFWAVAFPFGVGFIPTQIASTGIAGTVLWLAFFILLIFLGIKVLNRLPESRAERFTLISAFLITFFLWTASFLYTPSAPLLTLAFIFTGLFLAVATDAHVITPRIFSLKESPQARFASSLLIVLVALGGLFLGWTGFNKTAAAFHFGQAVRLSNTANTALPAIESELHQAIEFSPADTYYIALSRLNFAQAQAAASATTSSPEQNQAAFEDSIRKSIEAARMAVALNPESHQNWAELGIIYSALVPAPLSVEGAYENAYFAYSEASKRNPLNPEIPLLLARLELNRGNKEAARSFIRTSIALKEDYGDAYLMLAQLEVGDGNTLEAIASVEKLALLMPNNAGLYFELGLLKYANKDYAGAIKAFEAALAVIPNYANAQYYLGLALSQLGRLDEAQVQFESLALTNPDSPEVKKILTDLRAGKRTFLNDPLIN